MLGTDARCLFRELSVLQVCLWRDLTVLPTNISDCLLGERFKVKMGLPEWYTNDAVAQYLVQWVIFASLSVWTEYLALVVSLQWRIQGRDPGKPPALFLDQTEAQRAKKIFFANWTPLLFSGSGLPDLPLSQDLDPAVVWSIENCLFYFLIPGNVYVFIWIQIRTSIIYWCKYQQNSFLNTVPFHHYHVIMIIMSCHCHHHLNIIINIHPSLSSSLSSLLSFLVSYIPKATGAASPCKVEVVCSLKNLAVVDQLYLPLVASKRVHLTGKHVLIFGWKQDMFCCQTVHVWVGVKRMFMNVQL